MLDYVVSFTFLVCQIQWNLAICEIPFLNANSFSSMQIFIFFNAPKIGTAALIGSIRWLAICCKQSWKKYFYSWFNYDWPWNLNHVQNNWLWLHISRFKLDFLPKVNKELKSGIASQAPNKCKLGTSWVHGFGKLRIS